MRSFLLCTVTVLVGCLLAGAPAAAQTPLLTADDQPIRIGLTPAYQRYDDGGVVTTQASTALDVSVPVGERMRVSASARAAQSDTDDGAQIQALDDAQVGLAYAQPVGDGSLVGRVDVSLPVGKKELTPAELRTVRQTSLSYYDFRVPSFGSGTGVVPRVTYAVPLSDRFVLGVGGAYQYFGSYRPIRSASQPYDPGNGMEVFGGADVQITRRSALALDLRYARFGTARSGDVERLEPGSSYAGTLQYSYTADAYTVRVAGRYQRWDESRVRPFVFGPDAATPASTQQLVPSRALFETAYERRFGDAVFLRVQAGGHYYRATSVTDRKRVGVLTVRTSFRLTPTWVLTPSLTAAGGDFLGLSGALRTEIRL